MLSLEKLDIQSRVNLIGHEVFTSTNKFIYAFKERQKMLYAGTPEYVFNQKLETRFKYNLVHLGMLEWDNPEIKSGKVNPSESPLWTILDVAKNIIELANDPIEVPNLKTNVVKNDVGHELFGNITKFQIGCFLADKHEGEIVKSTEMYEELNINHSKLNRCTSFITELGLAELTQPDKHGINQYLVTHSEISKIYQTVNQIYS